MFSLVSMHVSSGRHALYDLSFVGTLPILGVRNELAERHLARNSIPLITEHTHSIIRKFIVTGFLEGSTVFSRQ